MIFNKHLELQGQHAFLGASKYYWINYDEDKLAESFLNQTAAQRGTELHEFAASCIRLGQRLPKTNKTLNMYVNDAINFRMTPEQVLYYSENCFGTCDAICYRNKVLRIHDYKSGVIQASMNQLLVYTAMFFLEYKIKPEETKTELRIYQNDEVLYHLPELDEIVPIMDKIVRFDKIIWHLREQEEV